ncbi:MAG: gfo/Idh/MocA family oxidoreductase, partial [Bryobacterales bacterium]|nr:gfo/Idh/MocA family oxidoreductase [Bryobacterales bacterium]MCC7341997.1 gfo/Idh/MocA family oxidoreductase [Bryobacterales bacterium]
RDKSELGAPIAEGATSCDLMHLGNISYLLGRTLHLDPKTRTVKNDPEAAKMFTRNYRKPFVVPEKV